MGAVNSCLGIKSLKAYSFLLWFAANEWIWGKYTGWPISVGRFVAHPLIYPKRVLKAGFPAGRFFKLPCFFRIKPLFSSIDETGILIGYKNPNTPVLIVAYEVVRLKLLNNNDEQYLGKNIFGQKLPRNQANNPGKL